MGTLGPLGLRVWILSAAGSGVRVVGLACGAWASRVFYYTKRLRPPEEPLPESKTPYPSARMLKSLDALVAHMHDTTNHFLEDATAADIFDRSHP